MRRHFPPCGGDVRLYAALPERNVRVMLRLTLGCLSGGAVGLLLSAAVGAEPPAKPTDAKATPGVAAFIGTEAITVAEVDERALKKNMKLAQLLYDARKQVLDQIILERLLGAEAASKSMTVDKLLTAKLAERSKPVADADVAAYYEANKARMQGKTIEQVSDQIKGSLGQQRENEAKDGLLAELKAKNAVKVALAVPRVEVPLSGTDPAKGPATAKVTVVEFSDFQ